jgi:K+-transporting ATPase ATPase C chain
MVLFGGVYHVGLWAFGQIVFPAQTQGSMIRRDDGSVIGSSLVAQAFTRPEYFYSRPSAIDYNAASTGGSNFGPSIRNTWGCCRSALPPSSRASQRQLAGFLRR